VTKVTELKVEPDSGAAVALRVETVDTEGRARSDIVVSALEADTARTVQAPEGRVEFQGRYGLVRVKQGKVAELMLVGGGKLACGGKRLDLPGDFRGQITATNVEKAAVAVRPDPGSAPPSAEMVGRKLLVRNPAYVCPAVYTIEKVEKVDPQTWRVSLNMPLLIARGVVGSVNAEAGTFASCTPIMKLRVNAGLFDGRPVRAAVKGKEYRLKSASEAAFQPAERVALSEFKAGGEYFVYDIGAGDAVEVVAEGARMFP
jgi:hypothetical protein